MSENFWIFEGKVSLGLEGEGPPLGLLYFKRRILYNFDILPGEGETILRCLRFLRGNVSLGLEGEGPPLGLPFTAGIGMSIKGETERLEIGEIQLGNRWKYNLEIGKNTT